jgi:predicted Rossmann-fold nucleotide-binding protein
VATVPAVCVFCSSSLLIDERYSALAHDVGAAIARRGWTLVSGAVDLDDGRRGARRPGRRGHTIGVIPDALVAMEVADHDSDEFVVTPRHAPAQGHHGRAPTPSSHCREASAPWRSWSRPGPPVR